MPGSYQDFVARRSHADSSVLGLDTFQGPQPLALVSLLRAANLDKNSLDQLRLEQLTAGDEVSPGGVGKSHDEPSRVREAAVSSAGRSPLQ